MSKAKSPEMTAVVDAEVFCDGIRRPIHIEWIPSGVTLLEIYTEVCARGTPPGSTHLGRLVSARTVWSEAR